LKKPADKSFIGGLFQSVGLPEGLKFSAYRKNLRSHFRVKMFNNLAREGYATYFHFYSNAAIVSSSTCA
jgi:hypothetical protein